MAHITKQAMKELNEWRKSADARYADELRKINDRLKNEIQSGCKHELEIYRDAENEYDKVYYCTICEHIPQ